MQKALIVTHLEDSVDELNQMLGDGWIVTNTCPMPSSRSAYGFGGSSCWTTARNQANPPTCLVILSKSDNP